ncbi:MAG TPA: hypothetical protein EYG18_01795 [Micavibrio sp.]|nr:hypothetical protein [Micavibrio sp.]HIL27980.1 hypothetical protein [Micavibrio sp.]
MPTYSEFTDLIKPSAIGSFGSIITYSIIDDRNDLDDNLSGSISYYGSLSDEFTYFPTSSEFSSTYQQAINTAIEEIMSGAPSNNYSVLFSDVLNISLINTSTNLNSTFDLGESVGDIIIGITNKSHSIIDEAKDEDLIDIDPERILAFAYPASYGSGMHGDIWINTEAEATSLDGSLVWELSSINQGSLAYNTIIHEISHSLGLDDFGKYSTSNLNNQKYSVMSYSNLAGMDVTSSLEDTVYAGGLQLYDIAALQSEYGRNYNTRDTNTTYSASTAFTSNNTFGAFIYTIWDGGGNDTIDASTYTNSQGAVIDLRQGEFSSIGYNANGGAATDNVAIAYHTIIEGAIGTSYSDIIIGNAWDNTLKGGDGNDRIFGDGLTVSLDSLVSQIKNAEAGYGTSSGEYETAKNNVAPNINNSGDDKIIGGAGDDTIYGGAGEDIADYSEDAANGGNAGITVNMNDTSGTVVDGFGDTDTLISIERIIATANSDTFNLNAPSGLSIESNGGTDTVNYTQDYVIDWENSTSEYQYIWDSMGRFRDTLYGIDLDDISGIVRPDYTSAHDILSAGPSSLTNTTTDYSSLNSANAGLNFTIDVIGNYTDDNGFYEGHRLTSITVDMPDNSIHDGSLAATSYAYGNYDQLFNTDAHFEIVGTNFGDTITVREGLVLTNVLAFPTYFETGNGDDTITFLDEYPEDPYDTLSPLTGVQIEYRGGHDVIMNASALQSIFIWEGIDQSEVNISLVGNTYTLDAGDYGTLTLYDVNPSQLPTITWLASTASYIEGTWGQDKLISHVSDTETFYAKTGKDLVGVNGGDTVYAGGDQDYILVSGIGNTLYGDFGNDEFKIVEFNTASGENDFFGGEGNDTAYFSGNYAAYTLTNNSDGTVSVTDSNGGIHNFDGVETLQFNDGKYIDGAFTGGSAPIALLSNDSYQVSSYASASYALDIGENDALAYESISFIQQGALGSVEVSEDGKSLIYTTTLNVSGTDLVSYGVQFADGTVHSATVSIDIVTDPIIWGTQGDDVLTGTSNPNGEISDDIIYGFDGQDTLISNGSFYYEEILNGGEGYDKYYLTSGQPFSIIQDNTSLNRLYLDGISYDPNEASNYVYDSGSYLEIYDPSTYDLLAYIYGNGDFGALVFDNNTTVMIDDLLNSSNPYLHVVSTNADYITAHPNGSTLDLLGGDDYFYGSSSADYAEGGAGADRLYGYGGDDVLYGGDGDDIITGDDGNDLISDGLGDDSLSGGNGADEFVITSEANASDTINDFDPSVDTLNLSNFNGIFTDWADFQSALTQSGTHTIVSLGSGQTLTLFNVTSSTLTLNNVIGLGDFGLPHAVNNGGSINEDTILTLTTSMLDGYDRNSADNELVFTINTATSQGTLKLDGVTLAVNDTFTVLDIMSGIVTYTPDAEYNGSDSFDFTLSDGTYTLAQDSFDIAVNAVNDIPTLSNIGASVDEDTVLTLTTSMLDGSDVDNTDTELTFTVNVLPSNGILKLDGVDLAANDTFTVQDIINGDVTYTPTTSYTGSDSFDFTLSDGIASLSQDSFTITVNAVGPNLINGTAGNDTLTGTADADEINGLDGNDYIVGAAGDDVLNGGDGSDLIEGNAGSDTMTGGAGADSFVIALDNGSTDTITDFNVSGETIDLTQFNGVFDSFSELQAAMAQVGSDTHIDLGGSQTLVLENITSSNLVDTNFFGNAGNLAPTLSNNGASVDEDNVLTLTTAMLDGADGDNTDSQLVFTVNTAPSNGVLKLSGVALTANDTFTVQDIINANVTYTPNSSYSGSDSFDFTLSDGTASLSQDNFAITVNSTGPSTIDGTSGNDTLSGTTGDDILNPLAGNDTVNGGDGNDTYIYTSGDDTFDGGSGVDIADYSGFAYAVWVDMTYTSSEAYTRSTSSTTTGTWSEITNFISVEGAIGTAYHDELLGDANNNIFTGLAGSDIIKGHGGNDIINGGTGNDTLEGGAGDDGFIYNLGDGEDTIYDASGDDYIQFGTGITQNDLNFSYTGNNLEITITGSSGDKITITSHKTTTPIETLVFSDTSELVISANETGTSGNDSFYSTIGSDTFIGGDGDDVFYYQLGGDDLFNGGNGSDTADYSNFDYAIWAKLNTNNFASTRYTTDLSSGTWVDISDYISIENITGTDYSDELYGDSNDNTITGGAGNDIIEGSSGDDILAGGTGNDELEGGSHDDEYHFNLGDGQDTFYDISGTDLIRLGAGIVSSDLVFAYNGNDLEITITGSSGDKMTIIGHNGTGSTQIEKIVFSNSSELDISLTASGTSGNDTMTDTIGPDTLSGLDGDDTFYYEMGGYDVFNGGNGSDTVSYANYDYAVWATLSPSNYSSTRYDADLSSGTWVNINEYDSIENLTGSDYADDLFGDNSDNVLNGGAGNDHIEGKGGADTLIGGSGADNLEGDGGNDILYGGDGLDTLWGEAGDDVFVFENATAFNNIDVVKDFDISTENDALDISDILDNTSYVHGTDPITDWVEITTSGSNSIVKVDTTGTGTFGAGTQIATLEGITGLTDEAALVSSGNLIAS